MFGWLKNLFLPPGTIDLSPAFGRVSDSTVRPYVPKDFEGCCELYRLNEPARFPPGHLPKYEEALKSGSSLILVVEENNQVIATAGISITRYPSVSFGTLSYGLVHPKRQGQGLGTTLLLARLALLPVDLDGVCLFAVPKSRGFYERFCFSDRGIKDARDDSTVFLFANAYPDLSNECRSLLINADADIPRGIVVPTTAADPDEAKQKAAPVSRDGFC